MHKLNGNNITLTRGDTLIVNIELTRNGEPYTPAAGDSIRFALKHRILKQDGSDFADVEPLANITIPNDTLTLEITPNTTTKALTLYTNSTRGSAGGSFYNGTYELVYIY